MSGLNYLGKGQLIAQQQINKHMKDNTSDGLKAIHKRHDSYLSKFPDADVQCVKHRGELLDMIDSMNTHRDVTELLVTDQNKCIKELQAQLEQVRGLPASWRKVSSKLRSRKSDVSAIRAANYLDSAANELQAMLEKES